MAQPKKVTRLKIGQVVTMKDGGSVTVKGYLTSEGVPPVEQLRGLLAPIIGADVKVCPVTDIVGYVGEKAGAGDTARSSADQIMWGT